MTSSCDHSIAMSPTRAYRAGESVEDFCRPCKTDRLHTIIVVDAQGQPLRVMCGYCRSEHNYRGGPRVEPSQLAGAPAAPTVSAAAARPEPQRPPPPRRTEATGAPFDVVSERERI